MTDDLMPMPNSATMTEPPADAGAAPASDVGFHDDFDALSPTALGEEGGVPGGAFDDDGVPEAYALTKDQKLLIDPTGPSASFDRRVRPPERVQRGGSFLCCNAYCFNYRPSSRIGCTPDSGMSHLGFRCVKSPVK